MSEIFPAMSLLKKRHPAGNIWRPKLQVLFDRYCDLSVSRICAVSIDIYIYIYVDIYVYICIHAYIYIHTHEASICACVCAEASLPLFCSGSSGCQTADGRSRTPSTSSWTLRPPPQTPPPTAAPPALEHRKRPVVPTPVLDAN